jgi:hypothetical protein
MRSALIHFQVEREAILQLLHTSVTSHRRLSRAPGSQINPNYISLGLIEVLDGILKGRTGRKTQSSTLTHLLEVNAVI